MIEVRPSPGKGRGLFATQDIKAGTVLSKAPVSVLDDGCYYELDDFIWQHDGDNMLTWGPQSFCNHDPNPNCICAYADFVDYLISIKNIKAGEELFIDYGEEE